MGSLTNGESVRISKMTMGCMKVLSPGETEDNHNNSYSGWSETLSRFKRSRLPLM
jgi:hypothetical protein